MSDLRNRRRRSRNSATSDDSDAINDETHGNNHSLGVDAIHANGENRKGNVVECPALNPDAEYIKNCETFELEVDPNVVIALRTKWEILKPTNMFGEGAMLPLMGVLEDNTHVKRLNLAFSSMKNSTYRAAGNGNSNARVLKSILSRNGTIEDLDLSGTGLDDDGIVEICDAIKVNKALLRLNLSNNYFGETGANALKAALESNRSLKYIDVSHNALGFEAINSLLCSCLSRGMSLKTNGNYVVEEIMNSVSHGLGFLLAIVGAVLLVDESLAVEDKTDYKFWSCVLFSSSLLFLFLSSTLYHSFFMLPAASRVLQTLDHVGIYLLIAGTYTPYMLIGLHNNSTARVVVSLEWVAAICGSVFSAISDLNSPAINFVEVVIFVIMGCSILFVSHLMSELSEASRYMIIIGGMAYLIGIPFYAMGEMRPIYHVVWHLFVLTGAVIHWLDIYFNIVGTDLQKKT